MSLSLSAVASLGAVTGTVVGSDGQAVAGARVAAFALETADQQRERWASSDPIRKPLVAVLTGADGNFAIDSKWPVVDLQIDIAGQPAIGVRAAANEDVGVLQIPAPPLAKAVITASGKLLS